MPKPEFAIAATLRAGHRKGKVAEDANQVGFLLTNEIKVMVSKPGTGRIYPRGKGGFHQASAPGEPPAVDTGVYRASWKHEIKETGGSAAEVWVFAAPAYLEAHDHPAALPVFLEFGTSKMAARPHVRPSVLAVTPFLPSSVAGPLIKRERNEARRQGGRG